MSFINPGSGPVAEATEQQAVDNMQAFHADLAKQHSLAVASITRTPDTDYGDGRYAFELVMTDDRHIEIQMPGGPLDQMREGWVRLYVDGNSWYWDFALDSCLPLDLGDGS